MMKKILVIDDDQLTARVYQSLLQKAGYQVQVAYDGKTGLERFAAVQPDAVLLDLMLPAVSGIDVLAAIRASPGGATIPVIVFTNAPVADLLAAAAKAGATTIFSKAELDGLRLREAFRTALDQQAQTSAA